MKSQEEKNNEYKQAVKAWGDAIETIKHTCSRMFVDAREHYETMMSIKTGRAGSVEIFD